MVLAKQLGEIKVRDDCQVTEHCSKQCLNISKFEITGYIWQNTGTFSSSVWGNNTK